MKQDKLKEKIMSSKELKRLYNKWGYNSFLFTLACIIWFVWRVGTKPSRIGYPCQRVALLQISLFFGSIAAPFLGIGYKCIYYFRKNEYIKIARIALIIVCLLIGIKSYENYRDKQLKVKWSETIPESSAAAIPFGKPPSIMSFNKPVVSCSYDPSVDYGGVPPYDSSKNPVYDFVWETVERLGLGSSLNPLDDLINKGDTVLIKPNWVGTTRAQYTNPQVVRPLIDMAIKAGATKIYIGDGGVGVKWTFKVIEQTSYSDMVKTLQSRHPDIVIKNINLNVRDNGWRWISLDGDSSFAGSGYTHYDLGGCCDCSTMANSRYYSTPDPQGRNPEGKTLGWYAVSDIVLNTDVIINVPKMKTHQEAQATLSIKNFVGCTLNSTYGGRWNGKRIAHCKTGGWGTYFDNDVFWRAILDMNKIILYADKNGNLQPAKQRKYLSVLDGIEAMEISQTPNDGGTPYYRYVVLASIDPVALDMVACRVMGYDYNFVPNVKNAASERNHPVGISDPENIIVIGEEIDKKFNYVFGFNNKWKAYAGSLAITDFTPPAIKSINRKDNTITVDIENGSVAHVLYQRKGKERWFVQKMKKSDDIYSLTLPDTILKYWVLTQDKHLNTARSEIKKYN